VFLASRRVKVLLMYKKIPPLSARRIETAKPTGKAQALFDR
jgi:hypothetical protein